MISDIEIKSHQPTLADTGAQFAAKITRALTRPRCIWAGLPGKLPSGATSWDDREYRKRWLSGDTLNSIELELPAMLEHGDLTVDVLFDLRGLYETEFFSARTIEGTPPDENLVIRGGVVISASLRQRVDGGGVSTRGQTLDAARRLDYHVPDWLVSGFQSAASHEMSGGLNGSAGRVSWVYREGLTQDAIDDSMPVRVSFEIDEANIDYDRPVFLELKIDPYTDTDKGLLDTPRFEGDKGDDLPSDKDRPEADHFSIWLLGVSAWARS